MMVKLMWKLVVSASEPIILVNYYDCRGVASLINCCAVMSISCAMVFLIHSVCILALASGSLCNSGVKLVAL
jgi:hypothetical protein